MRLGWESLREKHVFERNRGDRFITKIPLQQNLISDATFTKPSLQRPNRAILWVCMCDMVLRETKLVTLKNKCFRYYFRWKYWPHINIKEFEKTNCLTMLELFEQSIISNVLSYFEIQVSWRLFSFSSSVKFWYLSRTSFRSLFLCFWWYLFVIFIYRKKIYSKYIFISFKK